MIESTTVDNQNFDIFHIKLHDDKYSKFNEISLHDRRASLHTVCTGDSGVTSSTWSFTSKLLPTERRDYIGKQLNANLPAKYLIVNAILLATLSCVLICIQLVMMAHEAALSEIAAGIWGGLFYFSIVFIDLALTKNRSIGMLVLTYVFHYIGFLIGMFGIGVINLVALNSYQCYSATRSCYNSSAEFLHVPMIVISVLCSFLTLVPLIVFKYKLKLNCNRDKFTIL